MKKRLTGIGILAMLLMVLVGCGSNPQAKYVKYLESVQNQEFKTVSFDAKIKDLDIDSTAVDSNQEQAQMKMGLDMIKNVTLSGEVVQDSKDDKLSEVSLNFKGMGTEIPIQMVLSDKEMYLSTDYLASFLELVSAFTPSVPDVDFSSIEGKYLSLQDMVGTLSADESKELKESEQVATEYYQAVMAKVIDYLNSKDKKDFSEKDKVISYTYNEKDFKKIMSIMQEVAESDKKYESFKSDESQTKIFDEIGLNVATKLDVDKNQLTSVVTVEPKGKDVEGVNKLAIDVKTSYKKEGKTIKVPAKEKIVSEDEMNQLMSDAVAEESLLTDEQFDDIVANLKENKEYLSKSDIKELLASYEEFLTEDQMKQVEAILK